MGGKSVDYTCKRKGWMSMISNARKNLKVRKKEK